MIVIILSLYYHDANLIVVVEITSDRNTGEVIVTTSFSALFRLLKVMSIQKDPFAK